MQRFDRTTEAPPAIFQSDLADSGRRRLRLFMASGAEKRLQASAPDTELPLQDSSVMEALRRLFAGKCAFCEAVDEVLPYRFRPTAEALPPVDPSTSHLYYAWLSDVWENVYSICRSCLPKERNYFPVIGTRTPLPTPQQIERFVDYRLGTWAPFPPKEKPVLLDPCGRENFPRSFQPQVDGELAPLSGRGAATIQHFNLNAPRRVAGRRERYVQYLDALIDALTSRHPEEEAGSLFSFSDMEFGGTWYLLLRRLARRIGGEAGVRPLVSPSRIARAFTPMAGQRETERRLRGGMARLAEEDLSADGEATATAPARPGRSQISRVELTNFKAIEHLTLDLPETQSLPTEKNQPAPCLLIIGENAAGKSSILEAVALILSSQAARQELGLAARTFILNPEYLGAADTIPPTRAEVAVRSTEGAVNRLTIEREGIREADRQFDPPAVFAYGAFRQYQHKATRRAPAKYVRNLFDRSVLANPERWLLDLDDGPFRMVVRALREIFLIDGEFDVIERDQVARRCFIVTAAGGAGATLTRTPLSVASSGFRSVLAMACDVMGGLMDRKVNPGFETLVTATGVVLIDEVEAHLHPRWKMQIMRGLRRALPSATFIVTTHDPLCLRGMEDREVIVLQRVANDSGGKSSLPVFVEQLTELPSVSRLSVEQLLTSDLFQLYSTDAPEIEAQLANVADLLAKRNRGEELLPSEAAALAAFEADIARALPIGMSEAHRVVQEAVAEFLRERRHLSGERLRQLRRGAKDRILAALRSI